jgi:hypothetical protein
MKIEVKKRPGFALFLWPCLTLISLVFYAQNLEDIDFLYFVFLICLFSTLLTLFRMIKLNLSYVDDFSDNSKEEIYIYSKEDQLINSYNINETNEKILKNRNAILATREGFLSAGFSLNDKILSIKMDESIKRGIYSVNFIILSLRDWLAISVNANNLKVPFKKNIIILPNPIKNKKFNLFMSINIEKNNAGDNCIDYLRDYNFGDNVKDINWKKTAKYNKLKINEYSYENIEKKKAITLIIDSKGKKENKDYFENLLETVMYLIENPQFEINGIYIENILYKMENKELLLKTIAGLKYNNSKFTDEINHIKDSILLTTNKKRNANTFSFQEYYEKD